MRQLGSAGRPLTWTPGTWGLARPSCSGRHTAASLARDAEVDAEIRRKTLGHADAAMTSHYTHIEAAAHQAAAEAVAALVRSAQ